ncbi:amidohydrolase family protein [Cognatishimia sp. WU-CL00825]|uniref:amidohydrolase family protein n=1 Tax=Cognatishimia sp. WU-CL00825 TaxID=3127658 RepID=UPI0033657DBA
MIIDSHQHFWQLSRGDYPWPDESVMPIFRDFGPNDLKPLLAETGVKGTVLVQATDTAAETEFLLRLAGKTDFVCGVVGWLDFSSEDVVETIDRLRSNFALKGFRPMLQNIEKTDWILQDAQKIGLSHMEKNRLCFDALIQPRHLSTLNQLAKRYPDLPIVIDHVAKPKPEKNHLPPETWMNGIKALATRQNVFCKLSGMVTEIGTDWTYDDVAPTADFILATFGSDRVMFGSDWPVVNLASDYATWWQTVQKLIAPLSPSQKQAVLGGNAQRFYRL